MTDEMKELTDEVENLAQTLTTLDHEKDSSRISAIKNKIAEIELGILKNYGGKAYFPLLEKFNGTVPYEPFCDIFVDALSYVIHKYNKEKDTTFASFFSFTLNKRVNDSFKEYYSNKNIVSIDDKDGEYYPVVSALASNDGHGDEKWYKTEIRAFVRIAPFIDEQKKLDRERSKKKWFEYFFTFDLTEAVKLYPDCDREAIAANDELFPSTEERMLTYLMDDSFSHMRDVVNNKLRNPKSLNKRIESIANCLGKSHPTIINRNAMYKELFIDVLGIVLDESS